MYQLASSLEDMRVSRYVDFCVVSVPSCHMPGIYLNLHVCTAILMLFKVGRLTALAQLCHSESLRDSREDTNAHVKAVP